MLKWHTHKAEENTI